MIDFRYDLNHSRLKLAKINSIVEYSKLRAFGRSNKYRGVAYNYIE
jgi:hypothetical protein